MYKLTIGKSFESSKLELTYQDDHLEDAICLIDTVFLRATSDYIEVVITKEKESNND